jgi:hypothetical protein
MRQKISLFLFIIGIILVCINVAGFFLPLRSPELYQLNQLNPDTKHDIILTEQQVQDVIKNNTMDRKQYLINVNSAVNQGVANYWGYKECIVNGQKISCDDYEGIDKLNLRVPLYENYILFFSSYILPEHFLRYEFTDYRKALELGIGVCDQQTIILDGILKSQNIESKMVNTPHHFFEIALADPATNEWWVLDPYLGVVIPYNVQQIQENPELLRAVFLKEGYSNKSIDTILMEVWRDHTFKTHADISDYSTKLYPFERLSYILIWLIPLSFMLPFAIGILRNAARKYKT